MMGMSLQNTSDDFREVEASNSIYHQSFSSITHSLAYCKRPSNTSLVSAKSSLDLNTMPGSQSEWRSNCPLNIALEIFGDRWTLLILRDLYFKGASTFGEFQGSSEGIATNILTDRLKKLTAQGILVSERSAQDARIVTYRPTPKGLDLLPVMVEMIVWAARYEKTAAPRKLMERMLHDRESFIAETVARFVGKSD
jgi:DNA-binding HxlR family transcriptional regulator